MEIRGMVPKSSEKAVEPTLAQKKEDQKLKQTCQQFESIFLSQLLTQMRKSIPKSNLMGEGKEEDFYQDMLAVEQSKAWSESGGIGLANLLYQQLRKNQ